MAAEDSGILMGVEDVKNVDTSTSLGRTSEYDGTKRTSEKVRDSGLLYRESPTIIFL
jgi:hypothetical protein